ncbi:MAG: NAD(P)-dependent oxidoreductase [Verrucomicrobiales bacterium]|nr:NAD(P)-dependent oxidoreductase [Verrucomicrobiales bacterium]
MSEISKIGWVGTGVMGRWMCQHLIDAGHSATVFTRTKSKADPLLEAGATWAGSPKEVAENSDVTLSIVGFPEDVRDVYLNPDSGILAGAKPGSTVVDMTTTEPSLALEIFEAAKAKDVSAIDAPVSGGDVGAREAKLAIMIGGEADAVETVRPLFEVLGKNIVYQGEAGAGQHTKMCNQIVIAGTMIGVCESLVYGAKAGLNLDKMLTTISKGAAGCWTLDNLAPRVLDRNFDPGFFVEHFIKDMGIALAEAKAMGLSLPGLALVHQLYLAVEAQGNGKLGTHALTLALEKMAGIETD